jgi:hypothetical protein
MRNRRQRRTGCFCERDGTAFSCLAQALHDRDADRVPEGAKEGGELIVVHLAQPTQGTLPYETSGTLTKRHFSV